MLKQEFLRIFKPFYYLSILLGACKYNLKENNIYINNKLNALWSLIVNMFLHFSMIFTIVKFYKIFRNSMILFIYTTTYILYIISHTVNHFLSYYYSETHVKLILTLQIIDLKLECNDLKSLNRYVKINVILYVIGYIVFIVAKMSVDPLWIWSRSVFIFSTYIFDLELIYSIITILYLARKCKKLNDVLHNIQVENLSLESAEIPKYRLDDMDIFPLFENIIDCIEMIEKTSKIMVNSSHVYLPYC